MREMLEAGVHFGHQKRYWNPKMAQYIFGVRRNIHIIDLDKTLPMLYRALSIIEKYARQNKAIFFVGTKRSAQKIVAEQAARCKSPYVNRRWLGGLFTNYSTVRKSLLIFRDMEKIVESGEMGLRSKKENIQFNRKLEQMRKSFSGIKDMDRLPDALFVIGVDHDKIAVSEAKKLGIPVIGVVDSNGDPSDIDYVIPGNDDASCAIELYCRLAADTILFAQNALLTQEASNEDDFVEPSASAQADALQMLSSGDDVRKVAAQKDNTPNTDTVSNIEDNPPAA